jgi:hypothetical protein
MIHEYFPPALIALNEEVLNHERLKYNLSVQEDQDVYIRIAEVAAYAGVVLDGTYTQEDIIKLADMLVQRLRAMRATIIVPTSALN